MNEHVDIVIVNYNTLGYLKKCLASIKDCTRYPYHLIIIDNQSTDGSKLYLKRLSQQGVQVIINQKNLGCAKAWNQGIRKSSGKYILFLNPDTLVTRGWLKTMVACSEDDSQIAVVGNKQVNERGLIMHAGVLEKEGKAFMRGVGERDSPEKYNHICDCLDVCGACYLIKRRWIERIGYFDEQFFLYAEETDYSMRVRALGLRVVYCPVKIIHFGQGAPINPSLRRKIHQQSCQLFDQKWHIGSGQDGTAR